MNKEPVVEVISEKKRHMARVVWFNGKRGFGFLACPDFPHDIFCHWQHINSNSDYKTLEKDQLVSFITTRNSKGIIATDILVENEESDDGSESRVD